MLKKILIIQKVKFIWDQSVGCIFTFFIIVLRLQQPQFVVVKVGVATATGAREESVSQDRAAPVEWICIVVVTPERKDKLLQYLL